MSRYMIICLADTFDSLETDNIPITHGGRRAKLLFNTETLPDLNGQNKVLMTL